MIKIILLGDKVLRYKYFQGGKSKIHSYEPQVNNFFIYYITKQRKNLINLLTDVLGDLFLTIF